MPYSLREISNELCIQGQPSAKSSSVSSSTVAPWQPTTTEGAFKLRISMVAVKANTHCFSFIAWPDGVGRPADSSTNPEVGAT